MILDFDLVKKVKLEEQEQKNKKEIKSNNTKKF
jgi:hypothetical protein